MLYLVITEKFGKGRSALEIAQAAIRGGVDMIQLREKDKPVDELIGLGRKLSALCKKNRVKFIINDDPVIAKMVEADGVHLGQEDIKKNPIDKTRRLVGRDKMIGVSTHSLAQFEEAKNGDFDYIAFGPIFPTETKDYHIGTGGIKDVLKITDKPVFFIGGIMLSNMDEILAEGGRHIALIRDIIRADDIEARAMEFKTRLDRSGARGKMEIRINGKGITIDNGISMARLVSEQSLNADHIVVGHNLRITQKEEWPDIILREGDNVEIVSFVGGG